MQLIDEPSVTVESVESTTILTVNRPKSLNALNQDVLQSLLNELEKLDRDKSVRAVIITGSGEKAFVAGADITTMSGLGSRAIADYVELGQRAMRAIESFPYPVVGAINGYALGGGLELALACDLLIAGSNAKVGQPEVNLGIIPGFGGTQRLIHRCGVGTARRLCYTGELLAADEALRCGVIDKVVAPEKLREEALAWCAQIASKAPLAVKRCKQVIRQSQEQALLSGLRLEVEAFLELFRSADREEGMDAFLTKRAPRFTGR